MNYSVWKEWYSEIAKALLLSEAEDRAAAERLSSLLRQSSLVQDLKDLLHGKTVIVLGAGPSLEVDLKRLEREGVLSQATVICADGATSAYLRCARSPPGITVSDLDGNLADILYANRMGTMLLVHAHGDNIPSLNQYVPLFRRPMLGTTQVRELSNVYNFGGFTDGDRAAFAAEENGADPIILAGMDLGSLVGPYSKPGLSTPVPAGERKLVKLGYARRLLEWLAENGRADLLNCTRSGEDLKGIPRVSWRHLRRIIH